MIPLALSLLSLIIAVVALVRVGKLRRDVQFALAVRGWLEDTRAEERGEREVVDG